MTDERCDQCDELYDVIDRQHEQISDLEDVVRELREAIFDLVASQCQCKRSVSVDLYDPEGFPVKPKTDCGPSFFDSVASQCKCKRSVFFDEQGFKHSDGE